MDVPLNQVFFPSTFQELFSAWEKFPNAVPFAGGTEIMRNQGRRIPKLPRDVLCLDKLDELKRITRTERYLEIGAMVPLNDIIYLGKAVPDALICCLKNIAGPQVRNLATIGGNLCYKHRRLNAFTLMVALDALFELRSQYSARWISASRFASLVDHWDVREIISRIRVPLDQWDYFVYKKFSSQETDNRDGASILILRSEKNILTDLRIVFAERTIIRDKNLESILIGRSLPLTEKDAVNFVNHWSVYLSGIREVSPLLRSIILNFIKSGVSALTDIW
ncbi:MAG: FAD binding domain-containing protein [Treponema sp.]|jgi:CO/xanthine dehydrogenase FAD-binding subunit|nr:FAD binding domain-containing protein [Treponema sp.]